MNYKELFAACYNLADDFNEQRATVRQGGAIGDFCNFEIKKNTQSLVSVSKKNNYLIEVSHKLLGQNMDFVCFWLLWGAIAAQEINENEWREESLFYNKVDTKTADILAMYSVLDNKAIYQYFEQGLDKDASGRHQSYNRERLLTMYKFLCIKQDDTGAPEQGRLPAICNVQFLHAISLDWRTIWRSICGKKLYIKAQTDILPDGTSANEKITAHTFGLRVKETQSQINQLLQIA